jgi:hypothetical protein
VVPVCGAQPESDGDSYWDDENFMEVILNATVTGSDGRCQKCYPLHEPELAGDCFEIQGCGYSLVVTWNVPLVLDENGNTVPVDEELVVDYSDPNKRKSFHQTNGGGNGIMSDSGQGGGDNGGCGATMSWKIDLLESGLVAMPKFTCGACPLSHRLPSLALAGRA